MSIVLFGKTGQSEGESLTAKLKSPEMSDIKKAFGVRHKTEAACFKVLSTCDPLRTELD